MNKQYPPQLLIALIGLVGFLVVVSTFGFKDRLFSTLFPKSPSQAANPQTMVISGDLTLTSTFNSIGVELKNTAAPSGILEYKKQSDAVWKTALPLWQAGGALYGSVLLAQSGTTYDIRVTPQGGTAITGSIGTRDDNIPSASALTPTHFVRVNGDDANNGTSEATAWKTAKHAIENAPADAIVQFGPGYYSGGGIRTLPGTFIAQFPALDDNRNDINPGNHTVIESGVFTSPGQGKWLPVSDPQIPSTCKIYKWASPISNSNQNNVSNLAYAATRNDPPKRIAYWERKGSPMFTLGGWGNILCTNKSYNFGYTTFGTNDIFARLPQDIDPNSVYVYANGGGVEIQSANVRVSGIEFRQGAFTLRSSSSFAVLDHNLMIMGGIYVKGEKPGFYGHDHVVQYNKGEDFNIWSDDPNNKAINWTFIKGQIILDWQKDANGNYILDVNGKKIPILYSEYRIGAASEGSGFLGGDGGTQRTVIRYNTVDGVFNGVSHYNVGFDRYATQDTDIHDNIFRHIGDDTFEPEQVAINWRIWNNRVENVGVILSTGPAAYGPIYLFRNQGYKIGYYEGADGLGSLFFKYSGGSNPMARIYVINNTFWTNIGLDGGNQFAGGGPGSESFYLRNNIFHANRYAFKAPTYNTLQWDETNNYFSSIGTAAAGCTKTNCGLGAYNTASGDWVTDVAGYRSNYQTKTGGRTTNTNVGWNFATGVGNFNYDPGVWFNNVSAGDLSLKSTSPFVDTGAVVPNIAECFAGSAPDLGATEVGTPTNCTLGAPTVPPVVNSTPTPTPPVFAVSPTPTPSTAPRIPGDIEPPQGDGDVDIFDYNQLISDFGKTGNGIVSDIDPEPSGDGDVDIFDYNLLVTNFGK